MVAPKPATAKPALLASYPQLFVSDIRAACTFFEHKLGFTIAFVHGEPPFYGQVVRDGARLNLRHMDEPVFDGDVREREHLLAGYIPVDDVKALYLEYKSTGADFHQTLKKQPWGAEDFVVRDPDGNLLLFASR